MTIEEVWNNPLNKKYLKEFENKYSVQLTKLEDIYWLLAHIGRLPAQVGPDLSGNVPIKLVEVLYL